MMNTTKTEFWQNLRRIVVPALKLALLAIVASSLIYWFNFSPIDVIPHNVERGEIISEVMGTGTLEARVKTTISAKISGRIDKLHVDQGDLVSAGDPLVELDDEELKQQVAIAEANLAATEAAIARRKTEKDRATAILTQADRDYARVKDLHKKRAISDADMDQATESHDVAHAGVAQADAAIAEAEKQRVAAEKNLEYHHARLSDTRIAAPFDGLIVSRQRDRGDVVAPGSAALTLISTDEMWISAWVDETEMSRLRAGQAARVIFRSEPNQIYSGKVARLGREADRETREFVVDVHVLQLPQNWAIGQRAEVFIETARKKDAVLVPAEYVTWRDSVTQRSKETSGVFVDVNGQAMWRSVELGLRGRDQFEVVKGLKTGERIVASADQKNTLTDNQKIALQVGP